MTLFGAATEATSIEEVAEELGVTPRTIHNALRTGKVKPRKLSLYIEKLDAMLGNACCIPPDIAIKLSELRLSWFAQRNHRTLPLWLRENAKVLEDACAGVFSDRLKDPSRFVGYSLVLGIAYIYEGILNAKNSQVYADANRRALQHLQNAHEYGLALLSPYLVERLVMQISCATFNPCEQTIVTDQQQRIAIKKKLEDLGTLDVCRRVAAAVRRDYVPLWNGVIFAVAAENYDCAAEFYCLLERFFANDKDPASGNPLLESIWKEYIVAHEKEELEAALKTTKLAEAREANEKSSKNPSKSKKR
jgi:AcrR family transcriptional regulator